MANLMEELLQALTAEGITLLYGPAGAGKSLLCLLAVLMNQNRQGKIFFIDCQSSSFPHERLEQLCKDKALIRELKERIFFIHPKNLREQVRILEKLATVKKVIAAVIVDNITYLYRLEKGGYGKSGKSYRTSKQLIDHVESLAALGEELHIPIILSSHIYSMPKKENASSEAYRLIGGKILEQQAKRTIVFFDRGSSRMLRIIDTASGKKLQHSFRIIDSGIEEA